MIRSTLTALIACATLIGGCAGFRPTSAPPLISPPPLALEPCRLPILPDDIVTWADLERVYLERGEALIACDQARRLAVAAVIPRE
ncbi:MAG: hypothetical protein J0L52_04725 [Caulobacterales bacterium]|nr:hypothetical protein [Caulobacterales bacterium]